ncbi:SPJ_0845 family protein [Agrilactobacillus fermenti]
MGLTVKRNVDLTGLFDKFATMPDLEDDKKKKDTKKEKKTTDSQKEDK